MDNGTFVKNIKSVTGIINRPASVPIHDKYPEYDGSYSVKPRIVEQTLPTKKKSMENDMTVEAINYLEVTNPEGGITVTIGYE